MYLTSGAGSLGGHDAGVGVIIGPRTRGMLPIKEGRRWAADNDAFHGRFSEEGFLAHLARLAPYRETCLFVACPDVVGDPGATAALFAEWAPRIRALGFPVAWVAQNGATPADIPDCDAVFIGGCTGWKLSTAALVICQEAKRRGLWVHIGRVNSARRSILAARMGADSVDGTYTAFTGAERGLRDISAWLAAARVFAPQGRFL